MKSLLLALTLFMAFAARAESEDAKLLAEAYYQPVNEFIRQEYKKALEEDEDLRGVSADTWVSIKVLEFTKGYGFDAVQGISYASKGLEEDAKEWENSRVELYSVFRFAPGNSCKKGREHDLFLILEDLKESDSFEKVLVLDARSKAARKRDCEGEPHHYQKKIEKKIDQMVKRKLFPALTELEELLRDSSQHRNPGVLDQGRVTVEENIDAETEGRHPEENKFYQQ